MKIKSNYLDDIIYWSCEFGEKAFQIISLTLFITLGILLLVTPIIVPLVMLKAGASSTACFIAGIVLGIIWLFLLGAFVLYGFKEHDPAYIAELEFFSDNDDFERPRRVPTESKKYTAALLFKRKANDLAFLICKEPRGLRRDQVHLAVKDSDHNIIFETTYPAFSKTKEDLQALYAQILLTHTHQTQQ